MAGEPLRQFPCLHWSFFLFQLLYIYIILYNIKTQSHTIHALAIILTRAPETEYIFQVIFKGVNMILIVVITHIEEWLGKKNAKL